MNQALAEFFKHNLWANLRLLDACAPLTDEQLDMTGPGTYGAVRDTLVHLFGTEERYVALLAGREPERRVHESKGFPGFEELRDSARRTGEALISIAEGFQADSMLTGVWRGEPYEMHAIVPIVQAINHSTEHRAHIVGILNQHGIETPPMDGWAYGEDTLDRKEE